MVERKWGGRHGGGGETSVPGNTCSVSILKILLLVILSALNEVCELCMIYMRLVFVSKVTPSLPVV